MARRYGDAMRAEVFPSPQPPQRSTPYNDGTVPHTDPTAQPSTTSTSPSCLSTSPACAASSRSVVTVITSRRAAAAARIASFPRAHRQPRRRPQQPRRSRPGSTSTRGRRRSPAITRGTPVARTPSREAACSRLTRRTPAARPRPIAVAASITDISFASWRSPNRDHADRCRRPPLGPCSSRQSAAAGSQSRLRSLSSAARGHLRAGRRRVAGSSEGPLPSGPQTFSHLDGLRDRTSAQQAIAGALVAQPPAWATQGRLCRYEPSYRAPATAVPRRR